MAENYDFMKSGFNNLVQPDNNLNELRKNIATLVCYFAKNALKAAGFYVSHSGRKIVVGQDIKKAMKWYKTFLPNHQSCNVTERTKSTARISGDYYIYATKTNKLFILRTNCNNY